MAFFHDVSAPSDGDPQIVILFNRGRLMHLKPFDLMPIERSSGCHVARGKSFDPCHLSLLLPHVVDLMIAWTRVHAIVALRSERAESNAPRDATRRAKKTPCGNIVDAGRGGENPRA